MNTADVLRLAETLLATLVVGLSAIWGAFALWYRAPGSQAVKALTVFSWASLNLAIVFALWQGWIATGTLAFAATLGGLLVWWRRILPSNDRVWADDVARTTTGSVDGKRVTLHNVRNFAWRTNTEYTQRWETRHYDLDRLDSVDMIVSYWSGRTIAHMLVSFGFDDGQHVAFSVEIRRETTQSFSEIGGFFKEFGLSIIAADERDVIRVRTNIRGEDDYLYRIRMPKAAMRSLFIGYIGEANNLVRTPRFYNTITVNCTTLAYHIMKRTVGYLPLNYRLLLPGYLPEYVRSVGGLDPRYSLEELRRWGRITDRARQSDRSEAFSADIRRGIPKIDPS
ncbi:MAG: DUF4105 domain-containing protein [Pseudomonadota bacterium]|nr:DUF4105 domain-containing protein [Pseudomonadota bacterium]